MTTPGHNSAAYGQEMGFGHNSGIKLGNWIAVSRDMRDHPVVGMGQPVRPADPKRGAYSKYEAWQDLIMEAKFRPFDIMNKGKVVTLQRGQLMAARSWLADRWNWSEKTVRVFISRLESEFMVRSEPGQSKGQSKGQRSGHYSNIINICNYDIYQTIIELMEATEGQSNGQSKGQSRASQGPENNKETRKQEEESPNGLLSSGEGQSDEKMTASKAARIAFDLYNDTAQKCGLPKARILNRDRARSLALRVKDAGGMDGFREALANLEKSAFLRGQTSDFKADLEFVCQAKSFRRLLEGGYGNGAHAVHRSQPQSAFRVDDIPDFMPRPREDA